MNIQVDSNKVPVDLVSNHRSQAYKMGHRDARHEAAQLGEHADCVIEELREALDDAKCHFYTLMNNDNVGFINEVVAEINETLKLGGN